MLCFGRSACLRVRPAALSLQTQSFATFARPRDPERPKLPTSPWLKYLADFRKSPEAGVLKHRDVMRVASEKWKGLPQPEQAKYVKIYEVEKVKYQSAFTEYVRSGKKEAWERDPNKPRRPLTAFLQFCAKTRPQFSDLKITEQSKKMSELWKSVPDTEKAPLLRQQQQNLENWKAAMARYKSSGSEEQWKKKVGLDVIENKEKKSLDAKRAKERAIKMKEKAKFQKLKEKAARFAKALKAKKAALVAAEKKAARDIKLKKKAIAILEKQSTALTGTRAKISKSLKSPVEKVQGVSRTAEKDK